MFLCGSVVTILKQSKVLARAVIPVSLYTRGSKIYRGGLARARLLVLSAKYGWPETLLCFGVAPGDDLLCTPVLRELRKRGRGPVWMLSNYPELFQELSDAARVLPIHRQFSYLRQYRPLEYGRFDPQTDRSSPPKRHVIAELCACAGITGEVALRPYLELTTAERGQGAWAAGNIAVQGSGLAATFPMRNKQWYPDRFQCVVDQLKDECGFVQLGSPRDPALAYTRDLRGKTTIREAASILSNASLFVGTVGFLMHLARAVECPSVIIYGGREAPWQSGYACNVNLYSDVPCAPCWLWNKCDSKRMCMDQITAPVVVQAVRGLLQKPRGPLPIDLARI